MPWHNILCFLFVFFFFWREAVSNKIKRFEKQSSEGVVGLDSRSKDWEKKETTTTRREEIDVTWQTARRTKINDWGILEDSVSPNQSNGDRKMLCDLFEHRFVVILFAFFCVSLSPLAFFCFVFFVFFVLFLFFLFFLANNQFFATNVRIFFANPFQTNGCWRTRDSRA